MDTIPLRPQTPSSQDGLEAESRKAESLPDTSGLLTLIPASGVGPVNFHVQELWIPPEGLLSRASSGGSNRSRAKKQRETPNGPQSAS